MSIELLSVRATSKDNDVMAITLQENNNKVTFECDCSNKSVYDWVDEITLPDKVDYINYNIADDDACNSISVKLAELEKLKDNTILSNFVKNLATSGIERNKFTPLTDRIFMVL